MCIIHYASQSGWVGLLGRQTHTKLCGRFLLCLVSQQVWYEIMEWWTCCDLSCLPTVWISGEVWSNQSRDRHSMWSLHCTAVITGLASPRSGISSSKFRFSHRFWLKVLRNYHDSACVIKYQIHSCSALEAVVYVHVRWSSRHGCGQPCLSPSPFSLLHHLGYVSGSNT